MVGFYGAGDVPGSNAIGPVLHDEELFATRRVTCVGQARTDAALLAARSLLSRLIPGQISRSTYCLLTERCVDAPCRFAWKAHAKAPPQSLFAGV